MRKAKYSLLSIIVLLALGQFALSLLGNYASNLVPLVFTQYPLLVWFLISIVLLVTLALAVSQYLIENKAPLPPRRAKQVNHSQFSMANPPYKYDVFVSYSHKNDEWVHTILVPKLEEHGFRVFTDAKFVGGTFGVVQMEEGVRDSKRVLAVFTPAYFDSEWSSLENVMAQILDPAARQRKLIPVLREDCTIPLRLRGIHYRDLREEREDEWQKLLQDLI